MNREKINELDPLIIDGVAQYLPCYAASRVQNRYHSVSSKRIAAWLRFPRKRQDGLFDCLHFARDYSDAHGFLYSAEYYLSFFPELPYPSGPFGCYGTLHDLLPDAYSASEDSPLGGFWGGSWFLLGRDLDSAGKRLETVFGAFRETVFPQLDRAAEALRQDPLLLKALELVDTADVDAEDAKDRLASELRALGENDRRGYPVKKIAAQLVWRKRGNKGWHQI